MKILSVRCAVAAWAIPASANRKTKNLSIVERFPWSRKLEKPHGVVSPGDFAGAPGDLAENLPHDKTRASGRCGTRCSLSSLGGAAGGAVAAGWRHAVEPRTMELIGKPRPVLFLLGFRFHAGNA